DGLASDLHVPLEGLAGIPLSLPDLILTRAIHPEQELFLGALRLPTAAIDRLDGLKRLKVVGDVFGQVGQQSWAKADDQVDTPTRAVRAQFLNDGFDVREVCTWFAAQVHVPLVLRVVPGSVRDTGIRMRLPSCHMTLSPGKKIPITRLPSIQAEEH